MRLKELGVQYFMGFGPWNQIVFDKDQQIVSIIGHWAGEEKRSNRSGKSTFVEAILYALYGKSRSKKEIELINKNYPDEDMIVELTFEMESGDEITIIRGRNSNNQIILELTDYEGADKKVIQERINEIVGLSYEDFVMTSFFVQGDIHTFMNAGPTGQKQVIAKWLEKGYWKEFEKKAKEYQNEILDDIKTQEIIAKDRPSLTRDNEIKNHINTYGAEKEAIEKVLDGLKSKLEEINNQLIIVDEIEDLEKEIRKIDKVLIPDLSEEIDDMHESCKAFKLEIPEAERRQKELGKLEEYQNQLEVISIEESEIDNDIYALINEISKKKAKKNLLGQQYKEMKKFDDICPVMHKRCIAIDSIEETKEETRKEGIELKSEIKILEEELEDLKATLKQIKQNHKNYEALYREVKSYQKMDSPQDLLDKIESYKIKMKKKRESIKSLTEERKEKDTKLKQLNKINIEELEDQKNELKTKIRVKNSEYNDIITNIADLQAELKQIKIKRKKAIEAEKELKSLNEQLNKYRLVSFMFSKNGIPSNQIEIAFQEIEDEANLILNSVSPDLSMEFSPDKEMKSWEENCLICNNPFPKGYRKIECPECGSERQKKRKDELSIIIKTRGNQIDFALESGGGKVLISLAIRLAFVRMLQRRIGVNLKLIVFDEIFGMLDETNREGVLKLLATTLIEDFGFSQIFCISHEESIRDSIPDVIRITRYDEYSEFEWE